MTQKTLFVCAALLSTATPAFANGFQPEFELQGHADLRFIAADGPTSTFDGGFGRLRFGDGEERVRIGEVAAVLIAQLAPEWKVIVHGQHNPDLDNEVDLVEAFVQYRPVSTSRFRLSGRAGAFFPEVSEEQTGVAWSNRFTLSNSATNTWIAEESRLIGVELGGEWRGDTVTVSGRAALTVGNDRSGVALALRGFTINDQNVGLFGGLRVADIPGGREGLVNRPFVESDNRVGYALTADIDSHDWGKFTAFYTNNLADLVTIGSEGQVWRTEYLSLAYFKELSEDWTLSLQALTGTTYTLPGGDFAIQFGTYFQSASALLGYRIGDLQLAVRGELFDQDDLSTCVCPPLAESGEAVTASATYTVGRRHQFLAETIWVNGRRAGGPDNLPLNQEENIFQFAYRFLF